MNPVLQSVHLERFPISTAHFTADGQEIIMAGKRKSFFVYDMMAGKITQIHGIRGITIIPTVCQFSRALSNTPLCRSGREVF